MIRRDRLIRRARTQSRRANPCTGALDEDVAATQHADEEKSGDGRLALNDLPERAASWIELGTSICLRA